MKIWEVATGALVFERTEWFPFIAVATLGTTLDGTLVPAVVSCDMRRVHLWSAAAADGPSRELGEGRDARPAVSAAVDGTPLVAVANDKVARVVRPRASTTTKAART